MPVANPRDHLSCLVPNGILLANLLNIVKSTGVSSHRKETIHGRVKDIIINLLRNFSEVQEKAFLPEESMKKMLTRFEATLEEFIKYDPDKKSEYEVILQQVNDFRYGNRASVVVTAPAATSSSLLSLNQSQEEGLSSPEDYDFAAAYDHLIDSEKQCLSCFFLFPADVVIKKRELIHCWVGMDLINSPEDGEEILGKLVREGLIDRVFVDKKLFNRYKMHTIVHLKLLEQVNNTVGNQRKVGSWSVLYKKQGTLRHKSLVRSVTLLYKKVKAQEREQEHPDQRGAGSDEPGQAEALVNTSQNTLNAKRFESLSRMKNIKVLHLGSWRQDPTKYIAVDEIDVFKDLKHLRQLRFLSLEGVSGIVELPESVYELKHLKVLDLRECHNLEFLPTGIDLLKNLTHLDLSQCYLLDHVPVGIASLTNLQVLKGFVINDVDEYPDQQQEEKKRGKLKHKIIAPSPCPFSKLAELKLLRKLTVRTRRTNFPTAKDLQTLCGMNQISCLRIAWVESSNAAAALPPTNGADQGKFPATLTKLELQAAPKDKVTRLLRLLSEDTDNYCLEKLYIIGGRLRELKECSSFVHVKVVRLRYLPILHIHWDEFRMLFPNLGRLDILGCPNLIFFPSDANGVWEPELQENPCVIE